MRARMRRHMRAWLCIGTSRCCALAEFRSSTIGLCGLRLARLHAACERLRMCMRSRMLMCMRSRMQVCMRVRLCSSTSRLSDPRHRRLALRVPGLERERGFACMQMCMQMHDDMLHE